MTILRRVRGVVLCAVVLVLPVADGVGCFDEPGTILGHKPQMSPKQSVKRRVRGLFAITGQNSLTRCHCLRSLTR